MEQACWTAGRAQAIDPLLDRAAQPLAAAGISANAVTLAACALGLARRRGDSLDNGTLPASS